MREPVCSIYLLPTIVIELRWFRSVLGNVSCQHRITYNLQYCHQNEIAVVRILCSSIFIDTMTSCECCTNGTITNKILTANLEKEVMDKYHCMIYKVPVWISSLFTWMAIIWAVKLFCSPVHVNGMEDAMSIWICLDKHQHRFEQNFVDM
jgi:hypothetical protein